MKFKPDEVDSWKRHPITEAYLEMLREMRSYADENVRIAVVSDRLHDAKMIAGQSRGIFDCIEAIDELVEKENDGSESSSL
mgnify:CR=1 FL=1